MPTVTELIAEVRDILDESVTAQWTDTQLRKWLNEGNRDLARATRHVKASTTINTIAGVASYAMPVTTIAIEHAYYDDTDGRVIPLIPKHMENLDPIRGYQPDREGTPIFFSTGGYSPSLTVILYPVPTATDHVLRFIVAKLPTAIALDGSGDASQVDTPAVWYDALADYCEMKALRRDRDTRWQEAWQMYVEKRDGLINNPDYVPVNREVVADPHNGYMPEWLVSFDGGV